VFYCNVEYYSLWVNLLWIVLWMHCECFHYGLWELLLYTALFGGGVVELEGRGASLEASPLALDLLGLGARGKPRRQASRHLVLGMPGLGRWDRPRAHAALATLPTSRPPKCRVTLAFLSLGCTPSAMWCLLPCPQVDRPSVAWHLLSFLLGALRALSGTWAAYTFNIIASKIYMFLV
jgi:hypothetical protein